MIKKSMECDNFRQIDRKTLRRSFNISDEKSAIHMASVWSTANGVVLGQEKNS
jgi:hypothetical protein